MNRRDFVWVSSLSSLALLIPITGCSGSNSDLNSILTLPVSLSYIIDEVSIREIGKLYLIKKWTETKEKHIKKLLLEDIDISNSSSDFSSLASKLEQKIKKDFESNRIVEIDGWILSETEAQQCAYFMLINP